MHRNQPNAGTATNRPVLAAAVATALAIGPMAVDAMPPAQRPGPSAPLLAIAPPERGPVVLPFAFPGADRSFAGAASRGRSVPWQVDSFVSGGSSPWIEQKVIAADGQVNDLFGFRVLVAGDLAFVSAPAPIARPGAVYVFERNGDLWEETQKISGTPPDGTPPNWSDFFGWSLALSGDTLVVGAPDVFSPMMGPVGGAYVFTRSGDGAWEESQLLGAPVPATLDMFGGSSAFSGDALLVGAWSRNAQQGAMYVFQRDGDTWAMTQEVTASDGTPGDGHQFGSDIAADGDRVLVGAAGPDWTSTGEYDPGAVYVFANDAGTLTEVQKLAPADSAPGDQFGFSVALDGTTAVVGAPAADANGNFKQGAAYVFDASGGDFAEVAKLVAADGEAFDQLGQAVAVRDGLAMIGMWSHNDEPGSTPPPPKPGIVHLFHGSASGWTAGAVLAASDGTNDNSFGWDVATDGASLLVGADSDATLGEFQGSAYFYASDAVFADGFDGN